MSRWIAMHCCEEADELQARHPNAFLLLAQIARRAKWKDCAITKLKTGQAYIGDWKEAGLASEQVYRTAKKVLLEAQLATFQPTNKGTVATLSNADVFSVSGVFDNDPANSPSTGKQQSSNGQITTNHTDRQNTQSTRTPKRERAGALPPEVIAWNSIEGLPSVVQFSKARERQLAARREEPFWSENWQAGIERLSRSSFAKGQNDRGWKATFDWFLKPESLIRTMEGKYDDAPASQRQQKPWEKPGYKGEALNLGGRSRHSNGYNENPELP